MSAALIPSWLLVRNRDRASRALCDREAGGETVTSLLADADEPADDLDDEDCLCVVDELSMKYKGCPLDSTIQPAASITHVRHLGLDDGGRMRRTVGPARSGARKVHRCVQVTKLWWIEDENVR